MARRLCFVLLTPLSEPLEDTLGNTFGRSCELVKITQGDFYMFCACSFSLVKLAPLLSGAPLMFFVLLRPLSEPLEDTLGNTFGCSCELVKITHGRD